MKSGRKKTIGALFRSAGSSGRKAHVISREGQWVVFKEGSSRVLYEFPDKEKAVLTGEQILQSGKVQALVLHNADGTVDSIKLAQ